MKLINFWKLVELGGIHYEWLLWKRALLNYGHANKANLNDLINLPVFIHHKRDSSTEKILNIACVSAIQAWIDLNINLHSVTL